MKWCSALALLIVLSGCAKNMMRSADNRGWENACPRGASHAEVSVTGQVVKLLGLRRGANGTHEGFIIKVNLEPGAQLLAPRFKVEDNVDITGYIPLHLHDQVELLGQLECNDYVIHWTHHDPRGRHAAGYIKVNGRTYQ